MKTTPQTKTRPAMQGEHTPGPWRLESIENKAGQITHCVASANGSFVTYDLPPTEIQEAMANARLIAAAPDLLALIKRAVEDRIDDQWLEEARAAIAKTKGGA